MVNMFVKDVTQRMTSNFTTAIYVGIITVIFAYTKDLKTIKYIMILMKTQNIQKSSACKCNRIQNKTIVKILLNLTKIRKTKVRNRSSPLGLMLHANARISIILECLILKEAKSKII